MIAPSWTAGLRSIARSSTEGNPSSKIIPDIGSGIRGIGAQ